MKSAATKAPLSRLTADPSRSSYPVSEMLTWKNKERRYNESAISSSLPGSTGVEWKVWCSLHLLQLGSNPNSALAALGPGASYFISLSPTPSFFICDTEVGVRIKNRIYKSRAQHRRGPGSGHGEHGLVLGDRSPAMITARGLSTVL